MHSAEQKKIEDKLAELTPENFWDVCHLLDFVTKQVSQSLAPDNSDEMRMLKNVRTGLSLAWRDGLQAECNRMDTKLAEIEAEHTKAIDKISDGIGSVLAGVCLAKIPRGRRVA